MTDHEETAKRLLPCYHPDGYPPCEDDKHNGDCPAYYRSAVAAALMDNKRQRDAAYVRGLERARQIADEIEHETMDYGIERTIAAEIEKAGK